jgi:iron complex transport system ATP-binding protein
VSASSLLTAQAIEVGYNSRPILSQISLAIGAGEFVGLVGPNGSGKSTLIRALSRVLPLVSGEVVVDSENIWHKDPAWLARRLAVVPQDSPVAFDFSVLDTVLMGRSPYLGRFSVENKHDLEIAWQCLQLTDMTALAHRAATAISGGERQRAVIARALAQEPKILLADEPIAHLDINHQIQILDLLARLCRERNLAVIAALHDLNLAASFCDRLVMLDGGSCVADGKPVEVLTEERLRRVYGVHAQVRLHPVSGRPYMTLVGSHQPLPKPDKTNGHGIKVHVICGAGTGADLFTALAHEGYDVSVGVVNVMDTDQQLAEALDLERVEEAPFSAISPGSHAENCTLATAAQVVVVCAMPFGPGNLDNLRAAQAALQVGKKVFLVNEPAIAERDFTDGEAARVFAAMVDAGAVCVNADLLRLRAGIESCLKESS